MSDSEQPSYERFDSRADFHAAIDRLLEQPGRELRVFDPDLSALRLLPTPEDIAALKADGYLGDAILELRQQQDSPDGNISAEIAGHALGLLTTILTERQAAGTAT